MEKESRSEMSGVFMSVVDVGSRKMKIHSSVFGMSVVVSVVDYHFLPFITI